VAEPKDRVAEMYVAAQAVHGPEIKERMGLKVAVYYNGTKLVWSTISYSISTLIRLTSTAGYSMESKRVTTMATTLTIS
jgi:transcriptional regulator CtsR